MAAFPFIALSFSLPLSPCSVACLHCRCVSRLQKTRLCVGCNRVAAKPSEASHRRRATPSLCLLLSQLSPHPTQLDTASLHRRCRRVTPPLVRLSAVKTSERGVQGTVRVTVPLCRRLLLLRGRVQYGACPLLTRLQLTSRLCLCVLQSLV